MNFTTLHFDTYKVVNLLKERGFTKKQAEGIMEAVQEVTISGVSTKEDVHDLEISLRSEINQMRTNLSSELNRVEIKIQKVSNDNLKFLIIQTLTIVGVMVALFQFMP